MKANFHSFSLGEGFKRLIQALLIAVISVPLTAFAQTPVIYETAKLLPSDGSGGWGFGEAVGVAGDIAVIGAWRSDSAYVFERQTDDSWLETAKLLPSYDGDYFGYAVSVTGEVAIVGAPYDDERGYNSGAAFVFERQPEGGWLQTGKLLPHFSHESAIFGHSIAMSYDVAVIGAPFDNDWGTQSGAAYVFERQADVGWVNTARLVPTDGNELDHFGMAVAVADDVAVITAPSDSDYADRGGSAYVFEYHPVDGWLQTAKLVPGDVAEGDEFGQAAAVVGETVMIGAWMDDDSGENSGSVYVFEHQPDDTWAQTAKLRASDGEIRDYFGRSLAASGDTAVVGASGVGDYTGAVYVFERQSGGSWLETTKLLASDGEEDDLMGIAVAVSGGFVVSGEANYYNNAAYVFTISSTQPGCHPVVDPPALDFGAIEVGETVTLATTLTNEGSEPCDVDASVASPSSEFLLGSASSFTVAADASVGMLVEYTPVDMGDDTGTLELVIADPASQIDLPLTGSAVEGVFNLNIAQFKVSKVIRYKGDKTKSISITLKVSNEGTIGGTASVTVIGIQAGEEIYVASDSVDVGVGSAPQTVTFPAYQPVTVGDITWTVTLDDGYPDVDEATAVTSVR